MSGKERIRGMDVVAFAGIFLQEKQKSWLIKTQAKAVNTKVVNKAVKVVSRAAAGSRSLVSSSRNLAARAASKVAKADRVDNSRISAKREGSVRFSSPGSPGDFFRRERARQSPDCRLRLITTLVLRSVFAHSTVFPGDFA
jgi:hypothetical protein